jgi:hypothetical protein
MWSQLSIEQQRHLGQIIGQMMQRWQRTHVEEVRDDGDID